MYKEAIKEHAYQIAKSRLEDDYVPVEELLAEQQKVEVRRVGGSASRGPFQKAGLMISLT